MTYKRKNIQTLITMTSIGLLSGTSHGALLSINGNITDTRLVSTGDYWQTNGETINVNAGGVIQFVTPQFGTIIQQNAAGTSTLNVNTGGTLDFSGASGKGLIFTLANNVSTAYAVLNLSGGSITGAADLIVGRDLGQATFNISAGTASFGSINMDVAFGQPAGDGVINFTAGSTGALTVVGADFEALWDSGDLTYDGGQTGTFAENFNVSGSTLTAVPEPSSTALLGLGGLALILRRRK